MDSTKFQQLKDYGFKLLSFRPRSEKELKGKLSQFAIKKGIPQAFVLAAVSYFREHNFINDREFASWWVEQRRGANPKGDRLITFELKEKGIDTDTIHFVLSNKDSGKGDEDLAWKVIQPKLHLFSKLPMQKVKQKVSGMLLRRGFDWDVILKIIDSLKRKAYNKE
ncbi:regulatory protein RecX [Candidatus Gottesmanbacteria bacterium]|nr:regulatory protein RecX [Candidatus Gottesmanbacteria bacterium]